MGVAFGGYRNWEYDLNEIRFIAKITPTMEIGSHKSDRFFIEHRSHQHRNETNQDGWLRQLVTSDWCRIRFTYLERSWWTGCSARRRTSLILTILANRTRAQSWNDESYAAGWYKLKGLITQWGATAYSGHYIGHVKIKGEWIKFDDEQVQEMDVEEIKTVSADRMNRYTSYMLVYEFM